MRALKRGRLVRLIDEPAIDEEIQGWVGRLHIEGAEGGLPIIPDTAECRAGGFDTAETDDHVAGVVTVAAGAEDKGDLALLPSRQVEHDLHGGAGVEAGADTAGEIGSASWTRIGQAAVAAEESPTRSPVRSACGLAATQEGSVARAGEFRVVGVGGKYRPGLRDPTSVMT